MRRHSFAIVVAHVLMLGLAVYLIRYHLPLRADFSYLLPQDAPAVRDLRKLEARVKAGDYVLALVEAPDEATRIAAGRQLAEAVRQLPPELVERVEDDDSELRDFFRAHRHLFVSVDDLRAARDALAGEIRRAKLKANPLYIDLDEPDPAAEAKARAKLDELQRKRKEAEGRLDKSMTVSADGRIALIQIRAPFRTTDAGKGKQLLGLLDGVRADVVAKHPGVRIGFTGSVVTAVAEHDTIIRGMIWSSVITLTLVMVVLILYFRSGILLVLLVTALTISTVASFGLAAITVGHLNAATAFLGAIIAGNGVNYGIFLIARYLQERRNHDPEQAMAISLRSTVRPTAVASLGAAIAYGSLAITSFRGFADFAVIGALGMLVCWVASYILLPALVLKFGRNTKIRQRDPMVGSALVSLIGFRRSGVVCVVAAVASIVSFVIAYRYVAADPFEYDIKQLRSEGDAAVESRAWMAMSDKHFGRGISGRTYIAADRPEQVPMIISALRERDQGVAPEHQVFGSINSILDAVPERQGEKLAILSEIRTLLDDDALEALDDTERQQLLALRPPDGLTAITPERLPHMLKDRLTETDGKLGLLISIRPAPLLDEWNGKDLIKFANAVREIELADGETVTTSGSSVIFADIVESIERDGPLVTGAAALGLVVLVVVLVGRTRRSAAVLAATGAGTLLMVATCALVGIKVNFLDFIALPITLGLGIDYAINVAHGQHGDSLDPILTLRMTGGTVFICSLTTIIGYGSLLISDNLAIRGFGLASLIGEITCVFTALVLVPAIIAVGRHRHLPPVAIVVRES